MITQMFIQLTFINPLLKSVFGASISGGTGAGLIGNAGSILGFAEGGMVPGPIGAPVPALVHGGERILTPEQQGGGDVIVNIIGAPEGTRVEESETAGGGKTLEVIIDDLVSENIRPGTKTHQKLGAQFSGIRKKLKRR